MSGQAPAQIDYDALADQARKQSVPVTKKTTSASVDYDALAAQTRQISTQSSAPSAPSAPSPGSIRPLTQRERFLDPNVYPVGLKDEGLGENFKNLAQRAGVGVFQLADAAVHPRQTVASILASLLPEPAVHAVNKVADWENKVPGAHYLTTHLPEQTANPLQQAYSAMATSRGPMETAGKAAPLVGQSIAGEAFSLAVPAAASDVTSGAESVARAATDTGKGPIARLVEKRQLENEKIDAVNADRVENQRRDQADAYRDYQTGLLKLKQGYEQSVRDATEKARTGTAADRAQYQFKTLAAKQQYDQAVRDATEKFTTDRAAAQKANAEAQRQYNQKIGETARNNRESTAAERAKADQAAWLQVGGSQLIYGLRQLDKALRDRARAMFDAVREKVGAASRPGTDLGTTARAALSKISGSSEIPKPFRDILGKYPETDPEFIEYQGAQIPKTNRLYDVLKQQGMGTGAPPVTFADLQGYYTETGAELSKGTLPGDVYQATKQLHTAIGDMMQQMANGAGAGKQFWDSRVFYRNYMDTFHEPTGPSSSGSPVAQALLAKDPLVAVDKFSSDSGERGIADLRRYSDSLANLAQDVQRTARTSVKVPARVSAADIPQPKTKSVPSGPSLPLPPVLESAPVPRVAALPLPPVLPEPETVPVDLKPHQTISSPDLVAARKAAAEARTNKIWNRGQWAATWPIFQAARALWGGHIPSIPMMGLESAGMLATVQATTQLLRYPPMIDFLTKARPEDVALIPPDLRGDLPGLVNLARQRGVKVAPALIAETAAMAGQHSQPAQQPPNPVPPQGASQ